MPSLRYAKYHNCDIGTMIEMNYDCLCAYNPYYQ